MPTVANTASFKLGCRPPRPEQQSRLLKLRKYVSSSRLPAPPATTNWRQKVQQWLMLANDKIGLCTCASVAHMQMGWSANVTGNPLQFTDAQVIALYSAITGYDPSQTDPATGDNPTDQGAVIVDVLNYWRKTGAFGNKLGAYVSVEPHDHTGIIEGTYLFGGLKCGVQLPRAWQGADEWKAPSRAHRFGDWAPGSWGGHDVPIVDYDALGVWVVSWGGLIHASWAAVDTYFTEAYPLLDSLWFNGQRTAPNGFYLDSLVADLQSL